MPLEAVIDENNKVQGADSWDYAAYLLEQGDVCRARSQDLLAHYPSLGKGF